MCTVQRLARRMRDFIEYRRIARTYARFPDATPEELAEGVTCIVCRDEMDAAKKLPCGHMFHSVCLRSWLVEQAVCPICRASLVQRDDGTAAPVAGAAAGAEAAAGAAEAAGAVANAGAAADGGGDAGAAAAAVAPAAPADAGAAAAATPPRRVPLTQGVMQAQYQQMVQEQMAARLRAVGLAVPPPATAAAASAPTAAVAAAPAPAAASAPAAAAATAPLASAAATPTTASSITAGSPDALRAAELQYAAAVQQMQWLNSAAAASPPGTHFGYAPMGLPGAGLAPSGVAWPGAVPGMPPQMSLYASPQAAAASPAPTAAPAPAGPGVVPTAAAPAAAADDSAQRAQLAKTIADLQALQVQVAALTAAAVASSSSSTTAPGPVAAPAPATALTSAAQPTTVAASPTAAAPAAQASDGLAVSPAARDAASGTGDNETSTLRQRRLARFGQS